MSWPNSSVPPSSASFWWPFGMRAVDLGGGVTALSTGVSYGQGIVAEALGTFVLMLAVMAVAVDQQAPKGWAVLVMGLAVASAILVFAPLTDASLNPARTFGPHTVQTIFGGEVDWSQFLLYIIGPLGGSCAAALVYDLVARPREVTEREPRADDRVLSDQHDKGTSATEDKLSPRQEIVARTVLLPLSMLIRD